MDRIYILYDSDTNEVKATSKDYNLIHELEYDYFIRDCYNEFCWVMYSTIYNKYNNGCYYKEKYYNLYNEKDIKRLANDIWNDVMNWYEDYIYTFDEDIIQ